MALFSVLLFAARVWRDPQRQTGWFAVLGIVLLAAVAGLVWYPERAGWIGFGVWLLAIVTPTIAAQQASTALQNERYGGAAAWSAIAALLHPFDDWPERARIWRIVAARDRVGVEATVDRLHPHRGIGSLVGRLSICLTYSLEGDWSGLLSWLKFHTKHKDSLAKNPKNPADTEQDINVILFYLQALGETNQLDRLVRECERLASRLEASTVRPRTYRTWLFAFAYSGDAEAVETLFASRLLDLPRGARDRWRRIAEARETSVRSPALELRTERPLRLLLADAFQQTFRQALRWALPKRDRPSKPGDRASVANSAVEATTERGISSTATPIEPETQERLEAIERRFLEEVRYGFHRPLYFPLLTSIAIVLNGIVFGLELALGGSRNAYVLYALGAVVPSAILEDGQVWRLLAGTFLHFGWLHLLSNMFGLFLLGQLAERWLGTLRYALVYLASGVGSMGLVVMTVALGLEDDLRFVVGASGAVMGVFGAIAALLWRGVQRDRAELARRNLKTVGLLLLLQTSFDVLNPQICATCHLSGAAIGFAVAWTFAPLGMRLRQSRR